MKHTNVYTFIYPVVSTGTKNKRIRDGLIKPMNSIDPETQEYEEEKGVMNCYMFLEDAEAAVKKIKERDPDKKVSVMGLVVTEGYTLPHFTDRKGHSKIYVSDYVRRHNGDGNYTTSIFYNGIEKRYIVMTNMSCVSAVFDPCVKTDKTIHPLQNPVSKAMGRCMDVLRPEMQKPEHIYIMPQVEQPGASVGWLWWLVCIVFGFIMGIAFDRFMERYQLIAATFLVAGMAGCALAWIVYFTDRK